MDSAFQIMDSGFLTVELGFWIKKPKILNSTRKNFRSFGFHKQKFPGFWNPDSRTWGDLYVESWNFSEIPVVQKFPSGTFILDKYVYMLPQFREQARATFEPESDL